MLSIAGDDEIDIIKLPNGMTIKMDFSTEKDKDAWWGFRGRITGKYRRIRLYDKEDNLISETIEENPSYFPPPPEMFDDIIKRNARKDPKVIY